MKHFGRILASSLLGWLPLATLTILLTGTIYVAVQQSYRTSADDPQLQMAGDARDALERGATPASLVPQQQFDIATSLAPYLAIYDDTGQVVAASATLHGQPLMPPPGVFTSAKRMPQNALTWQPEPGVRSAIVVMRYSGGYVLAGRSLREVEARVSNLEQILGAACIATLALTYCATVFARLLGQAPTPRNAAAG